MLWLSQLSDFDLPCWTSGSSSIKWDDTNTSKHQCSSHIPWHSRFQFSPQHLLQLSRSFSQPNYSQPPSVQDFMSPGVSFPQEVVPLFLAHCVGQLNKYSPYPPKLSSRFETQLPTTVTYFITFPLFIYFSSQCSATLTLPIFHFRFC